MKTLAITTLSMLLSFSLMSQDYSDIIKKEASDIDALDEAFFGEAVAISGNYAVVTATRENEDENGLDSIADAGAAYIFEKNNAGNWVEVQKIVASDRKQYINFGLEAAISGNYIIIGTFEEEYDANGSNALFRAGAAYIFERDSTGTWNEVQKIVASDRATDDRFGFSVAISGNYAMVGAILEDEDATGANTLNRAGAAYVFKRDSAGTWAEFQKLVASDRDADDRFGISVSMDGNNAVVGAQYEKDDANGNNPINAAGSAYIFQLDTSGQWQEVQKITAADRHTNDNFGNAVGIHNDQIVVSAIQADFDASGNDSVDAAGAVYIFKKDGSSQWNQEQKLVASDRQEDDRFGHTAAIFGEVVVVGARNEDHDLMGNNPLMDAGSVYFFEKDTNGTWEQITKVVAIDRLEDNYFGGSVGISGNDVLIGSPRDGFTYDDAGSAYFIRRCAYTYHTIDTSVCNSFTSPGGTDITSSGTYMDTLTNSAGCDSIVTINLTVATGNAPPCDTTVAIVESSFDTGLMIYPNPTSGELYLDFGYTYPEAEIIITNVAGKVITIQQVNNARNVHLNMQGTPGLYFVKIQTSKGASTVLKVLKE